MSSASEPGNAGRGGLRGALLVVFGVVVYQFLVHLSLARPQGEQFSSLLAALPVSLLAIWLLGKQALAQRITGGGLAIAAVTVASNHGMSAALCYFLVQLAAYMAVLWLFAGSLRAGTEPLITRMARSVHGSLPVEIERYTRRVTWYWSAVLALLAAVSAALFLLAPLSAWSFFANVLNAPLLACAFVAEYGWRIARYPHFSHASMTASLGAFRRFAGRAKSLPHD